MAKLAIRGHATRGKEVIEVLEMLGGINKWDYLGDRRPCIYYINCDGIINYTSNNEGYNLEIFTIEEFLEKFPYKVGDKVKTSLQFANCIGNVKRMRWEQNEDVIIYDVEWQDKNKSILTYYAQGLQPYKEETMESKPNLLQQLKEYFDNTPREVIEKEWNELSYLNEIGPTVEEYLESVKKYRQTQYPKTYEECCEIIHSDPKFYIDTHLYSVTLEVLYKLLICRNAYWQIAGEQMGLGKPWEPNWRNSDEDKHCIEYSYGRIDPIVTTNIYNYILAFPTKEMRGAFYENFKDLIEQCKELL